MGALANGVDARFAPGSNVKERSGANWCFLLSLDLGRIVCLSRAVGSGAHHVRATRQRSGGLRAGQN